MSQTNPKNNPIDTNNPEFQNALNLIRHTHQSIFLTGKAGTGKSTFLRYVCANTRKKNVILAPTGIAAINAGGQTLHSFFKLPFHPLVPDDPKYSSRNLRDTLKYSRQHIKLIKELELIVIDEISMVRADIIDFIDKVLRIYCHNTREPFAGKQMLFIGDVFQLEPVVKSDEREILARFYPNPMFFSANVFHEMELVSIELTKVYRQKDDTFIHILDHIRQGCISSQELQLLNQRYTPPSKLENDNRMSIVLATRRDNVDFINQKQLQEIEGEIIRIRGEIKGEFPESSLPTALELEIKEGAQIIFIKNDSERRWVNGTLGVVDKVDLEHDKLYITTDKGISVEVERECWGNVKYTYNEKENKIEEEQLGVFTQYPIRLAWAITIHKSQGLTFSQATIDFGGGTFAGGQAYVALSRCTSLEGMTLNHQISYSDIFVRSEIKKFAQQFNDTTAIQRALNQAKADIEYHAAAKAFDEGDMPECLNHFFTAIHTRYDIERPGPRRLIQRKLNQLNKYKTQRDEAVRSMHEMESKLKALAKEYYQMGNECILSAKNSKAALKNYYKALDLDPKNVDVMVRIGVTQIEQKEFNKALHILEQATTLSPTLFKAWLQKGRALLEMEHYPLALSSLLKALGLKDNSILLHESLSECYSHLMDEERAEVHRQIAQKLSKKKKK